MDVAAGSHLLMSIIKSMTHHDLRVAMYSMHCTGPLTFMAFGRCPFPEPILHEPVLWQTGEWSGGTCLSLGAATPVLTGESSWNYHYHCQMCEIIISFHQQVVCVSALSNVPPSPGFYCLAFWDLQMHPTSNSMFLNVFINIFVIIQQKNTV